MPLAQPARLCRRAGFTHQSVRATAVAPAEAPLAADTVRIPGGKGKAVHVKKGDTIRITNTFGTQVRAVPARLALKAELEAGGAGLVFTRLAGGRDGAGGRDLRSMRPCM